MRQRFVRTFRLNRHDLHIIIKEGVLDEFSEFLFYKTRFKNGCVYDYTPERLSQFVNIPPRAIKRHIKVFLSMGWCKMHCGNLIFLKPNKFSKSEYYDKVNFTIRGTIKEIRDDLYLVLLRQKQSQFEYLQKLGRDNVHPQNDKIYKSARKRLRSMGKSVVELPRKGKRYSVSYKGIAKFLKISVGSAFNLIQRLIKKYKIWCYRHLLELKKVPLTASEMFPDEDYTYYFNGYFFKRKRNEYNFNSFTRK